MQLCHFLQVLFLAGIVSAQRDARQVIVTVTAGVTPTLHPSTKPPTAPSPVPLTAAPVPWEQPPPSVITAAPVPPSVSSSSGNLALPPATASAPNAAPPVPTPVGSGSGIGPKCGKGYTYCGYMLTGGGHNFAQVEVDKSYCSGLPELCASGKHKTNPEQAVFVCMSDQPSSIQLLCACSGTCLNNATTNYIAHCDEACVNK